MKSSKLEGQQTNVQIFCGGVTHERSESRTAVGLACDVTSWDAQTALFELAIQTYGQAPQIVIPNAGIGESFHLGSIEEEEGKPVRPDLATVDINLVGVIYSKF